MPRISNPELLQQYKISDIDDSGETQYFGFTDKNGNWYILALTSTTARYALGSTDYSSNWTNRSSLSYDYFFNVF